MDYSRMLYFSKRIVIPYRHITEKEWSLTKR
ncbi:hypothetical protein OpiT1DRAFT_00586 [Opitutaceae bacterium TAV1]|nr:hypothetical protein OpiT1DRAFT_00586 [Opitutaceae bacterium TAV1]